MSSEISFRLRGCRELLNSYGDAFPIRSAIDVIERSIPNDPGLVFTHCRGLIESVCRTILTDRGVPTPDESKPNWLMSETLKALKLTPDTFDNDNRVENGTKDVLGGLNRLVDGVVALRNSQGVGPHGKDALEAVLDADYAIIIASAIDAAVALLYRLHKKQSESDPLKRIRLGDYANFDTYLDDKYVELAIEETPIQASKALYLVDFEAYRQRLMTFLAEGSDIDTDEFSEGEAVGNGANE